MNEVRIVSSKRDAIEFAAAGSLISLAWLAAPVFGWMSIAEWLASGLAIIPMAGASFAQVLRHRALAGRGLFLNDTGIGAIEDGETAWMLPWHRFGWAEPIEQGVTDKVLRARAGGFRVFDRDGQAVGNLVTSGYSEARLMLAVRQQILQTLREQTQEGRPFLTTLQPATPPLSIRTCKILSLIGSVVLGLGVFGVWVVTTEPNLLARWQMIATLLLCLGGAGLLMAGLMDWWAHRPKKPKPPRPEWPDDKEFRERLIKNGKVEKIDLIEGVSYASMDPDYLKKLYADNTKGPASVLGCHSPGCRLRCPGSDQPDLGSLPVAGRNVARPLGPGCDGLLCIAHAAS